jgi:carnitine O-acetyltransferase
LQYAAWAADGQGVDRHLFGLKKSLKEGEPLPEIYSDPSFSRTNHWELSTSQLSSDYFDGWGYGEGPYFIQTDRERLSLTFFCSRNPVVPDGYGLSYAIGDNYIRWSITSLKRNTAELKHYLAEAATETRAMMENALASEKQGAGREKL